MYKLLRFLGICCATIVWNLAMIRYSASPVYTVCQSVWSAACFLVPFITGILVEKWDTWSEAHAKH